MGDFTDKYSTLDHIDPDLFRGLILDNMDEEETTTGIMNRATSEDANTEESDQGFLSRMVKRFRGSAESAEQLADAIVPQPVEAELDVSEFDNMMHIHAFLEANTVAVSDSATNLLKYKDPLVAGVDTEVEGVPVAGNLSESSLRPQARGLMTSPRPQARPVAETPTGAGLMSGEANTAFVDDALNTILKSEGGFQNDTEDTGNYRPDGTLIGTNRGITPNALASYRGVDPDSITVADVKGITEDEARAIYRKDYFEKPKIDQLPVGLQETVFDMYINAGGNAIKILQREAGLTGKDVDGILGPQTLTAIKEASITKDDYADARIAYYTKVAEADPSKAKYLKGWTNRANKYRSN